MLSDVPYRAQAFKALFAQSVVTKIKRRNTSLSYCEAVKLSIKYGNAPALVNMALLGKSGVKLVVTALAVLNRLKSNDLLPLSGNFVLIVE